MRMPLHRPAPPARSKRMARHRAACPMLASGPGPQGQAWCRARAAPCADGAPTEGVDWSSVEQVAGHVSRTTLAGMQQLWRNHSAAMDGKGRQFAETVYAMHAQAIRVRPAWTAPRARMQPRPACRVPNAPLCTPAHPHCAPPPSQEVASMKTFDLKPVLTSVNGFTAGVRETVLEIFQVRARATRAGRPSGTSAKCWGAHVLRARDGSVGRNPTCAYVPPCSRWTHCA